ncbi:hypothetical protein SAMD00019534_039690 [Acytostelium subglobosum LB1]|uniref:hypothetical protein n=1 Tax=Acytostelium subglobosum LB1 TaxID=1410327 RepID=UPI0006449F06|nr:hypothetical protein SAMD00019534_039690 [Acytostelium subglobosum LB1]GAM20794.1 hypothetical protein SAMD00019534_039690 [Acytostelium subglobosum LB1]|eukprot:XP_012755928.1 hypothetical protein SAMD00019534_039690 [Acytostelium subglobosum LB1]
MDLDQVDYEEFINSLEDYVPTIPDEVITYYLNKTGFECSDQKIKRMISLATQKFISDVANDSMQFCKIRQQAPTREKVKKEKQLVLTMDDLSQSLRDYGINIRKPDYFAETIPPQQQQQPAATTTTTTTTSTTSTEKKDASKDATNAAATTAAATSGSDKAATKESTPSKESGAPKEKETTTTKETSGSKSNGSSKSKSKSKH